MTCPKSQCQNASCAGLKSSCRHVLITPQQHLVSSSHFVIVISMYYWFFVNTTIEPRCCPQTAPFICLWVSWYLNSLTYKRWCWPRWGFTHLWPQSTSFSSPALSSLWNSPLQQLLLVTLRLRTALMKQPSKHRLQAEHPLITTELLGGCAWAVPMPWPWSASAAPQSSTDHSITRHTASGSCRATWVTATNPGEQLWKQHPADSRNT